MPALTLVLWALLAILGAVAIAHVTGVINPHENVNGLWLVVAAACIYVLAYRFLWSLVGPPSRAVGQQAPDSRRAVK